MVKMKIDFTYAWAKEDFADYIKHLEKVTDASGRHWLDGLQIASMTESERLNLMLPVIVFETERDCIDSPVWDELYLYYEQYAKGELDNVIDVEERQAIVHDLTECFNKVFPEGLID